MKKLSLIIIGIVISIICSAQSNNTNLERVLKVMFINPGVELDLPIYNNSILSTTIGVGFEGAYKNLMKDLSQPDYNYFIIAPFLDIRYKNIYDQKKRKSNSKNIEYNTGNYWGVRSLIRGKEIYSSFERFDNIDFSFGPVWGMNRSFGKLYFQIDIGPMYYFDTKGNSGVFPVMFDVNIGYNLKKF